jgi:hypothetical protein
MNPQAVQPLKLEVIEQDAIVILNVLRRLTLDEGLDTYLRFFQAVQQAKQLQQSDLIKRLVAEQSQAPMQE